MAHKVILLSDFTDFCKQLLSFFNNFFCFVEFETKRR